MTFRPKLGGTYRINSTFFPAPETEWEEQPISPGLTGIPFNASYKIHRWNWNQLEAFLAEDLYALFESQQSNNTQLSTLETDPFDATGGDVKYGTTEYSDFVILDVSTRTRGLPNYTSITVVFEVYIS